MRGSGVRSWAGAAVLGMVLAAGIVAGPAAADPPPLVWQAVAGYPKVIDGFEVTWETSSSPTSPFGGDALLDPVPVIRVEVTNVGGGIRYLGVGTDFVTRGSVDHLWNPQAWVDLGDEIGSGVDLFWLTLQPGQSLSQVSTGAQMWHDPVPMWSGHTLRVFTLSGPPDDLAPPTVATLDSYVVTGRFVGANLTGVDENNPSELIGRRASVTTTWGAPDLFPGLTASVTASGLTPGENLEFWVAPDMDYFYFALLGGVLPATARMVGSGVVQPDGTLVGTALLPADLPLGRYQLAAGVRTERYWPAGSYGDFTVEPPPDPQTATTVAGGGDAVMSFGQATTVTATFPASASAGDTTAVATTTGPVASGFLIPGDPPLYYHLSTTATFTGTVTVCIDYNIASPGGPLRLYHFDSAQNRWVDITTSSMPGRACGVTSSFSPFALGAFDFGGFFDPVSNGGPNVAKAGQSVPVKFSLAGDQGLEVIASARFVVEGTVANPAGEMLDAATAGQTGLSYDPSTDTYTYVWKTQKAWASKIGHFVLTLSDGSEHTFPVSFKK